MDISRNVQVNLIEVKIHMKIQLKLKYIQDVSSS